MRGASGVRNSSVFTKGRAAQETVSALMLSHRMVVQYHISKLTHREYEYNMKQKEMYRKGKRSPYALKVKTGRDKTYIKGYDAELQGSFETKGLFKKIAIMKGGVPWECTEKI